MSFKDADQSEEKLAEYFVFASTTPSIKRMIMWDCKYSRGNICNICCLTLTDF